MEILVDKKISLTEYRNTDKAALIRHLNDIDIYKNTLQIPYPYTEDSADFWLDFVSKKYKKIGQTTEFAIRNEQHELIGAIGRLTLEGLNGHADEIGYWLAKTYWNQGIMTKVVKRFTDYCFEEFPLFRIGARVFSYNIGSQKVLQKCGFQKEGYLRKAYKKDDQLIDAVLFAKLKTEND